MPTPHVLVMSRSRSLVDFVQQVAPGVRALAIDCLAAIRELGDRTRLGIDTAAVCSLCLESLTWLRERLDLVR